MPRMSSRHGARNGKCKTRSVLLHSMAGVLVLGLFYVASRTLPLATASFEEWAHDVVMSSHGGLQPFLAAEASRRVELPAPQPVDEDIDMDFAPLLDAFDEADLPTKGVSPRRTHEVSVSVRGQREMIVYHYVIEWFSWRVADISKASS